MSKKKKKTKRKQQMSLRDQLAFNRVHDMLARLERENAELRRKHERE